MAFDHTRANPNIGGNQNSVTTIVGDTFVGAICRSLTIWTNHKGTLKAWKEKLAKHSPNYPSTPVEFQVVWSKLSSSTLHLCNQHHHPHLHEQPTAPADRNEYISVSTQGVCSKKRSGKPTETSWAAACTASNLIVIVIKIDHQQNHHITIVLTSPSNSALRNGWKYSKCTSCTKRPLLLDVFIQLFLSS